MANEPFDVSERERRLDEILTAYLEAADAGQTPDPNEWVTRYPELASELTEFFTDQDRFSRLTQPLQSAAAAPATEGTAAAATPLPEKVSGTLKSQSQTPLSCRPSSFGDYELLQEIGHGGMGVVYKARQKSLNRLVALKMIRSSHWAYPADMLRFRNEAEAAAHLDHSHTVPIYEVGEQDGQHYFSMKLMEGGSLAEWMKTRLTAKGAENRCDISPRSLPSSAVKILAQVARAVHYAHRHGILHRDLKPANILLDDQGQPHVTDFGLAKRVEGDVGVTQSGAIVGTPSYMAPEQAGGKRRLTTAADIYSLGAILYELLAGRPPFRATSPLETLRQLLEQEPDRPRACHPGVDRDLETICLKCLEKDPERRYRSAEALAEDLERWLAGEPIQARPVGNLECLWRWSRRKPAVATLAASVGMLLIAIALVSILAAVRLGRERAQTLANQARAEHAEQDALEKLYGSYLAHARASRWSGRVGQRFSSLDALSKAAGLADLLKLDTARIMDLRNEAIACLALADLRVANQWQLDPACARGLAFNNNLERYAVGDAAGNVRVHRVADNQEIISLPGFGVGSVAHVFSPDGRFLAVKYHNDKEEWLCVWELSQATVIVKLPLSAHHNDRSVDFSPDSRRIALGQLADQSVRLYDLSSGKEVKRLKGSLPPVALRFHPDGSKLAVASQRLPGVEVYDLDTGQVISRFPHSDDIFAVAWRGDGKLLAAASADTHVYVWDATDMRQARAILKGHRMQAFGVEFNHRGDLLASWGWDSTLRLWDIATGSQVLSTDKVGSGQFSRDDSLLAYGSDGATVWIWEVAAGQECRTYPVADRFPRLDISPDGRVMASASDQGLRLWDLAAGKEITSLPIRGCHWAVFHSDGKSLITGGTAGVFRWPILSDAGESNVMQLGPPRSLGFEGRKDERVILSAEGESLAVISSSTWRVVKIESPSQVFTLSGQPQLTNFSLSPDCRWIATDNYETGKVQIWDSRTGKLVHELPAGPVGGFMSLVSFSPNGKWLVTSTDQGFQFWEPNSWQPGPIRIPREGNHHWPGNMIFTTDGTILALGISRTVVRLVNPSNGQEIATLLNAGLPENFNHDGSLLFTTSVNQGIQVWDLRRIRKQLEAMNLDWDWPPYPPQGSTSETEPLSVKVLLGKLGPVGKRTDRAADVRP